jgi:hypothetical protein
MCPSIDTTQIMPHRNGDLRLGKPQIYCLLFGAAMIVYLA